MASAPPLEMPIPMPVYPQTLPGQPQNDQAQAPPNPEHYVVPVVPNACVLLRQDAQYPKIPFNMEVHRHPEGLVCHQASLDSNAELLWSYFMTFINERPQMILKVEGGHHETRSTGKTTTTVYVTDFHVAFAVDPYIGDWSKMYAVDKNNQFQSFNDTLKHYTDSGNWMKEIQLNRHAIGWNFGQLEGNIRTLVQANTSQPTGIISALFSHRRNTKIKVQYAKGNHKITAYSSSTLMTLMKSTCFWFFAVITCLWIFCLPLYCCVRNKIKNQIVAEYPIVIAEGDFYNRIAPHIAMAVQQNSKNYQPLVV